MIIVEYINMVMIPTPIAVARMAVIIRIMISIKIIGRPCKGKANHKWVMETPVRTII